MDYGEIMRLASKNQKKAEKQLKNNKRYNTVTSNIPKKLSETKVKPVKVQSFLEKMKEEERKNAMIEEKRKKELAIKKLSQTSNSPNNKLASRTKNHDKDKKQHQHFMEKINELGKSQEKKPTTLRTPKLEKSGSPHNGFQKAPISGPINFQELIALAEKKQKDPMNVEKPYSKNLMQPSLNATQKQMHPSLQASVSSHSIKKVPGKSRSTLHGPSVNNSKKLSAAAKPVQRSKVVNEKQGYNLVRSNTERIPQDVKGHGSLQLELSRRNPRMPISQEPIGRKRRRIESEDSEYNDEDDDFIVHEGEDTNVSKYIREIFGYDKNKYGRESEYELKKMESSYREIQKEEARSTRLGIQEDLEDIRREKEEMKRKSMKKRKL